MRWLPWVRGPWLPWLRGPWLPCLRGPGLRRPWLRGRLRGRQLLRILGILPRVLSSTTYRPDAEKIGSNGLNSRFSQGRFGSNCEVDARIGEVCFAPMNGLRQSGLSGPKVRDWAHAPRQTTCTNRSNLFNHIVGAGE